MRCILWRPWCMYRLQRKDRGRVLNASRLQTKAENGWARDCLFADDCALNAATETKMQQSINRFAVSCRDFGFTTSTRKTEVMFQPAPQQRYSEPCIIVDEETLKTVDDFSYLCSTVSTALNIDSEVDKRIAKARSTFVLRASVFDRRGIKLKTKFQFQFQLKMASRRSERPIRAPPCLSAVSPRLPSKQYQYLPCVRHLTCA